MKVTPLPEVERGGPRRVAVGTFDGVHLGHREVIAGADTVLTFDPHPVSVVAPQHTPKLITTLARKAELIAGLGVAEMVVIPFDAEFAARSAASFIDDVLVGALGAAAVSVGENFRFGHRAQGDPVLLAADGLIAEPGDVFYLTAPEVLDAPPSDARDLVAERLGEPTARPPELLPP